jgi:hypothetical protein
MKALVIVGWLWPLLVVSSAVVTLVIIGELRDQSVYALFVASLLGTPIVAVSIFQWIPHGRHELARLALAGAGSVVVLGVELFLVIVVYFAALVYWDMIPA